MAYGMKILKIAHRPFLIYIIGPDDFINESIDLINGEISNESWKATVRREICFDEPYDIYLFVKNEACGDETVADKIVGSYLCSDDYFFAVVKDGKCLYRIDALGNIASFRERETETINDTIKKTSKVFIHGDEYRVFFPKLDSGEHPTTHGYYFDIRIIENILWE